MAKKLSNQDITGSITASGDITTPGKIFVNASSGDEGGEIFLNKPATNTSIDGGVNIDIYQNKLRFWEAGGTARGYYLDIPSGGAGVSTNLASGATGAMNYDQQQSSKQSGISASGTTIVSKSFTTNGYPVQVLVTGDAENSAAGGWVKLQLYRDSTAIGKIVHVESSAGSENVPFALTVVDAPAAGTYVYSLKTASSVSTGTMNFGETDGPVLTLIELAGRIGPTGATGATGAAGTNSVVSATAPITYNSGTQTIGINAASTTQSGAVQLSTSTSSSSTTTAATSSAVNSAYNYAGSAYGYAASAYGYADTANNAALNAQNTANNALDYADSAYNVGLSALNFTGGSNVGMSVIIPTAVAVGSGSGSYNATTGLVTFSAASVVAVSGIFSADYDMYQVIYYPTSGSTSDYLYMRLRAGTVTNSASSYYNEGMFAQGGSIGIWNDASTAATYAKVGYAYGSDPTSSHFVFDLIKPFNTAKTIVNYVSSYSAVSHTYVNGSFIFNGTNSFDGISIGNVSGGTIGGTIQVYGMRKN